MIGIHTAINRVPPWLHYDISTTCYTALIGLRGAGKSTPGAKLATKLGWPFIEFDTEVGRLAGMGLSELFSLYGQAGYRRCERRALGACRT